MKVEEKIKDKFLYKKGNNFFKLLYFFYQKYKSKKFIKNSYSFGAQDLIIDHIFRNKDFGFYIDIGCYHPYVGNNTKLLYDRGWSGINIDLDFHTIDFFNHIRKRDENINIAISNKKYEADLYFHHNRSAINSIDPIRKASAKEIRKIEAVTLDAVLQNSKFKSKDLDLLLIDVEGHEFEVLEGFDLAKYKPKVIIIEIVDYINSIFSLKNQNLEKIISSKIYELLLDNGYHLINWVHSDFIFAHKSFRE